MAMYDNTSSDCAPCHQTDKMHCCVCGQVYQDLARFIYHCQSHDEREYHKVCANKQPEPHTAVGPPALLAIPIEMNFLMMHTYCVWCWSCY